MDKALLFDEGEPVLVSAEEVLDGKYSREREFVDAEYPEYKVRFIRAGKPAHGEEIGTPYFRMYYSYEEYKKLYPDRADKYEIVADMRRFQVSGIENGRRNYLLFVRPKSILNMKTGGSMLMLFMKISVLA